MRALSSYIIHRHRGPFEHMTIEYDTTLYYITLSLSLCLSLSLTLSLSLSLSLSIPIQKVRMRIDTRTETRDLLCSTGRPTGENVRDNTSCVTCASSPSCEMKTVSFSGPRAIPRLKWCRWMVHEVRSCILRSLARSTIREMELQDLHVTEPCPGNAAENVLIDPGLPVVRAHESGPSTTTRAGLTRPAELPERLGADFRNSRRRIYRHRVPDI